MVIGWHKLQGVLVVVDDDCSQLLLTFVVHLVYAWTQSPFLKIGEDLVIDSAVLFCPPIFHWAYNNAICIVYIENSQIAVPFT